MTTQNPFQQSSNPFAPKAVESQLSTEEIREQASRWWSVSDHDAGMYAGKLHYTGQIECGCEGEHIMMEYHEGWHCPDLLDYANSVREHVEAEVAEKAPTYGFAVKTSVQIRQAAEALHRMPFEDFVHTVPYCNRMPVDSDIRFYGPTQAPWGTTDERWIDALTEHHRDTHVWVRALSTNAAARVTAARLRRRMHDSIEIVVNGSNVLAVSR